MITAMVFLFAGATSLSAVCATESVQPAKSAANPSATPADQHSQSPNSGEPSENSESDDGKADLGQPPSPVLERQVRSAPVRLMDHRGCAPLIKIAAVTENEKPRYQTPIRSITVLHQARLAGFPRSTNGPPTQ